MNKIKALFFKTPNKKFLIVIGILFAVYLTTLGYLIHNILLLTGIETFLRYAAIACLIVIAIIFLLTGINVLIKNKIFKYFIYIILIIIFISAQLMGGLYINRAYSSINKINKTEVTYSTSLISLKTSQITNINHLKNKKIGIIKDTKSVEGYIISQEIIDEHNLDSDAKIVQYDDYLSLVTDLYDDNIDAVFISSNYASLFISIDRFANIKDETNVITSKSKKMAKQKETETPSQNSRLTNPFTILLMGVDSDKMGISSGAFNGDTLILVTFNPKTLNATMLSIPRDTYVPIMCAKNHKRAKINSAAWGGVSCMISTIKNLTGINIDYYVKINFKGVVELVNALDGVTVDVPYSFCESDSNRRFGNNTIYVRKGLQTLNGEQALALSRNRHTWKEFCPSEWTKGDRNDFVRGQNQQLVVKALISKIKDIRDINKVYKILDVVEKNIDTNLTTNQILSFYNIGKDILNATKDNTNGEVVTFDKLYLLTHLQQIYNEVSKLVLDDEIYYEGSLKDVVDAMKINLELTKPTPIKTFTFSINTPYVQKVIGKGNYKLTLFDLVPNFTANTKQYAINWGQSRNIPINFTTINSSESKYRQDQIINQSIHEKSLVSMVGSNGITLTIISKIETAPVKTNCTLEENKDLNACKIPNFIGKKKTDVTAWLKDITYEFILHEDTATTNDSSKDGIIKDQNPNSGTSIYDKTQVTITYYKYEAETTD